MSSATSLSTDFTRDGIFGNTQHILDGCHFEARLGQTKLRFQGVEAMQNVGIVGGFGALSWGSGKGDGIVPRLHSNSEAGGRTIFRVLAVRREAQLGGARDGEAAVDVVGGGGGGGGQMGEEAGGGAFLAEQGGSGSVSVGVVGPLLFAG